MNRRIDEHFALIESLLVENPAVMAYQVTQRLVGPTDGKLRVKVELTDGGSAEFFEYVAAGREVRLIKYSFHCQDVTGKLWKRWDNAPHFPQLPNAPHHVHLADGSVVSALRPPDIISVLQELEEGRTSG